MAFNPLAQHLAFKICKLVLILSSFLGLSLTNSFATEIQKSPASSLRVLANHLPPYMYIENGPDGKIYKGFEHELATSLARELGLTLEYVECHWQECLHQLKTGEIDIVHNLVRSKTRETFLEFISPSYLKDVYTTVFYKRFNDVRVIDEFEDLLAEEFVIGYVGSTVYFPEFDSTDQLLKMDVKNRETGLRLLAAGKIDILAGFDELFDGMELENPNIKKVMKKTQYTVKAELESFTAISRMSPLLADSDKISAALRVLKSSGDIQKWKATWMNNTQTNTEVSGHTK